MAWAAAIPAIISLISAIAGSRGGSDSSTSVSSATTDPAISAMLASQQSRMDMQDPLYEAVTRLAMGLMPTRYQGQINPMGYSAGGRYGTTGQSPGTNPAGTPGQNYSGPFSPGSRKSDNPWTTPDELRDQRRTREYRGVDTRDWQDTWSDEWQG